MGYLWVVSMAGDNTMIEIIREAFEASGFSMKQLSERSGVGYACIHGMLTGTREPVLSTVARVAPVLGLELRRVRPARRTQKA